MCGPLFGPLLGPLFGPLFWPLFGPVFRSLLGHCFGHCLGHCFGAMVFLYSNCVWSTAWSCHRCRLPLPLVARLLQTLESAKKHKIFRALGGQPFLKFNGMFVCLWCFDATALTTAKCWFLAKMEEARAATLGRGAFYSKLKNFIFCSEQVKNSALF